MKDTTVLAPLAAVIKAWCEHLSTEMAENRLTGFRIQHGSITLYFTSPCPDPIGAGSSVAARCAWGLPNGWHWNYEVVRAPNHAALDALDR